MVGHVTGLGHDGRTVRAETRYGAVSARTCDGGLCVLGHYGRTCDGAVSVYTVLRSRLLAPCTFACVLHPLINQLELHCTTPVQNT